MNTLEPAKIILLVEDEVEIRSSLVFHFKEAGYQVLEAENGKKALECLRYAQPDLIVSDFLMPIINGLELCNTLKTNENTQHIPILMLSSFPFTVEMITKMKKLCIDSFIMKPYSFPELMECVKELLKRKSSSITIKPQALTIKPQALTKPQMLTKWDDSLILQSI